MQSQRIRIRLKAFDYKLIDQFVIKCLEANTNTLALHYLSFKERGAEAFFGPRFEMS